MQKTAYEMRISDWSSDVCSSDLLDHFGFDLVGQLDADRLFVVEFHHHVHAILKERGGIPQQVGRQGDLLVCVLVHEGQHVAVGEQELEILGIEQIGRANV